MSSPYYRNSNHRRKKSLYSVVIKNGVLIGLVVLCAGSLLAVGFIAFASRALPNPKSLTERSISQTTKIYDRTGEHVLYEIFGEENRTLKKMQEGFCLDDKLDHDLKGIPLFAVQATIAAEDRKFCDHAGFDLVGIARAVLENLRGNRVGGSTITQQLVKNAILSSEKKIVRKIKELILSVELERRYSKDEILQIYFNEIPYGSTYYGIEAASQNYFHKSVHELTLAEAATLAALPRAPTSYLNNPDRLQARRDYILDAMANLSFISEEEAVEAKTQQTPVAVSLTNIQAPHFVLYVKELLEEQYGRRAVEEGGLKVITTLDIEKQQIAEEEVIKGVESQGAQYQFTNASLVAIDPKNGQILAMVGSKDFFDEIIDGQVNVSTRLRQPGSSFKPMVYAKAFELGYTPQTILWDVATTFPTVVGPYTPKNYDLKERGPVRLRNALQMSLNIPAVKLVYLVGIERVLDFANTLGYTSFDDYSRYGLSVVLGGGEVKLLEHVNAYATFANEGIHFDPVSLLRVEDADGTMLQEWRLRDGKRVIDANIARILSDMLSDNPARAPIFGTNSFLQLGDRPVAAKTGTTNDFHDGWLVGYTPSLAVGVWTGNNDNTPMNRGGGTSAAGPIWNTFMRRALEGTPIETFSKPVIEQTGKAVLDGVISSSTVMIDKASGKLATEYTPTSYRMEKTFAQYHSILHYVNREDPRGLTPEHPEQDPQYQAWEQGIMTWITKREQEAGALISKETQPQEQDDVHVPENFPRVKIITPDDDDHSQTREVFLSTEAEAPRGVTRVEWYLDGYFLDSDSAKPFEGNVFIPNQISKGYHTLKAVAYDDVDNSGSDTIGVFLEAETEEIYFEIIDPQQNQIIERNTETYTIVLSLDDPERYQELQLFSEPVGQGGSSQLIGRVVHPSSPFTTFIWTLPLSGTWVLVAEASTQDGVKITAPRVMITVQPTKTESTEIQTESLEWELF